MGGPGSGRPPNRESLRPKGKVQKAKKKNKTSVKGQLRSLQRLLKKESLGHKVKKAVEAKMEALTTVYDSHKQSDRERQMAVRYHRVKFFERVKIERKIESLKKDIVKKDISEQEQRAARDLLGKYQEDLQYVMHFPKGEKYVSVLKDAATPEAQEALNQERERLRVLVRERIADEKMLAEVNEGFDEIQEEEVSQPKLPQETVKDPKSAATHTKQAAKPPAKRLSKPTAAALEEPVKQPQKKQKREKPPLPKVAEKAAAVATSLAFEDDFFLDEDRHGSYPTQTSLPDVLMPSQEKVHLGTAVSAKHDGHARVQKRAVAKSKKAYDKNTVTSQGLSMRQESSKEETLEEARKRTRAEGGRKRRKKLKK